MARSVRQNAYALASAAFRAFRVLGHTDTNRLLLGGRHGLALPARRWGFWFRLRLWRARSSGAPRRAGVALPLKPGNARLISAISAFNSLGAKSAPIRAYR